MEEIEQKLKDIKIKDENEKDVDEKEKTEKVSNRSMKLQKNKNKRDEKKKNKQSDKNKKETIINTTTNDNGNNDIEKELNNTKEESTEKDKIIDKNINITLDDANTKKNESEINKVISPIIVEYCKICSMPYEYCEYGKFYDECREENKDKYNYKISNIVIDTDSKKKVKKQEKTNTKISIQKTSRAKKKVVTVVTGLHAYVKLEKMSKLFSKTFACGSSVIKGTNNFPDHIDIQGDVGNSVVELIMKNCPEITEDKFVILAPK